MRIVFAAALTLLSGNAGAASLPAPLALYTCAGHAVTRIALTTPPPCCTGKIRCPQFLATTTLVPPSRQGRT